MHSHNKRVFLTFTNTNEKASLKPFYYLSERKKNSREVLERESLVVTKVRRCWRTDDITSPVFSYDQWRCLAQRGLSRDWLVMG